MQMEINEHIVIVVIAMSLQFATASAGLLAPSEWPIIATAARARP